MTIAAKQRSKETLEALRNQFLKDGDAEPVLRERTSLVDSVVLEAFSQSLGSYANEGLALLAVGGYGRRSLFPHSDVDLLMLVRKMDPSRAFRDCLSEFLRTIWDSGLRVSHSIRTVEECSTVHEGNFELTVSLLDQRLLTGDEHLHADCTVRFARFLETERRDLTRRMCRMARERHARYHDTIYRLEPDIKEMPGGFRDLQTVAWLRQLGHSSEGRRDDDRPVEFLSSVRTFLHFRAGRDNNLLDFEAQDDIAAAAFSPWSDPAEWMRNYYRHATHILGLAQRELESAESKTGSLLSSFRDWRSRLSNSEFTVSRECIFVRNPHALAAEPEMGLRLFLFMARHGVALAPETSDRLIAQLLAWSRHFEQHPPKASFWREFMNLPHAPDALRAMRSTGFLTLILPEWERIDHLVVRDFYHQYTVDEHTTVALEVLSTLPASKDEPAQRFAELLQESSTSAWLLRMAILLHDIGKGSGRDHSQEAVRLARRILERMGAEPLDAEMVVALIEKHLLLSSAMQSRDLVDPATARALAAEIHTVERLRLLTLLTFADISAVNSTAMNPWRMEQLLRLYRIMHRHMTGEISPAHPDEARAAFGEITPELEEFLEGLPERYLWTHTREEALAHTALFGQARHTGAAIHVRKRNGGWRATLVAADRPFLFASIAGAISSFGLEIMAAEAFCNARGFVADSFDFTDPNRSIDLNPTEVDRLSGILRRVALGELRAEDLLRNRPVKPAPSRLGAISPTVAIDNEVSPSATVVEVVAQDRPGLLYHLSSCISRAKANIEVVIVGTEAHKAIDVFHVTSGGAKLAADAAEELRRALLSSC
jgi:[protein-PII] uridylyltransferase